MPLGTTYVPDTRSSSNGTQITTVSADTAMTAGTYVTPTEAFSIEHNGVIITGYEGVPIPVDAGTKAFLLANAPVE